MKYSISNYFIKNLLKVLIHNYLEISKLLIHNYMVLSSLIMYNYKHIKRITIHIYLYNTSESYVKTVQKRLDSAGLHGSKNPKSPKTDKRKVRKDS